MWTCPKCREENEDSYEVCFNCGTSHEGMEDPEFRRAEDVGAEFEGDRPLVEALPETNVPEALQPREPAPVPHPQWQKVRCPNCQSDDLARDTASPWPVIVAALVLNLSDLVGRGGSPAVGAAGTVAGLVLLAFGLLGPFYTDNAWCRNCGVRFKKRYRIERPAEPVP